MKLSLELDPFACPVEFACHSYFVGKCRSMACFNLQRLGGVELVSTAFISLTSEVTSSKVLLGTC